MKYLKGKPGTDIFFKRGLETCPRCRKKTYGCTSETRSYNKSGDLQAHYKVDTKFCSHCVYMEGDVI
jgi:hypothetical protein